MTVEPSKHQAEELELGLVRYKNPLGVFEQKSELVSVML